jgi:hypothetical protein
MRAFSMRCKVISTVFNLVLISLKKFSLIEGAGLDKKLYEYIEIFIAYFYNSCIGE